MKEKQVYWDLRNYFELKSEVLFLDHISQEKQGIIVKYFINEQLLHIEYDYKIFEKKFEEVKRTIEL